MLRSYIEYREKKWHRRDKNRYPRPFEWGLEHLGLASNGDPRAVLRDFVYRALTDSDSFFSHTPTAEYTLDGEVLRFPSGMESAFPENNTVWCRFFEGKEDLAVVILPQWNADWNAQVGLCRALQHFGIGSLRMSLPYHHHRKPVHLERSDYMVAPNIGLTISASRQAVLDARRAVDWLVNRGYRRFAILGTSIGSSVAFLTFAHDSRFSAGIFIHVSSFFGDVVWTGLSTSHVRHSLEAAVSLEQLRFFWSPISPYPFIKRLRGTDRQTFLVSGRYDLTFLPQLSRMAFDEFERNKIPYELAVLPCGHYTMGHFPFNAIAGFRIVKFLTQIRSHV